jgi:hypothetical protein
MDKPIQSNDAVRVEFSLYIKDLDEDFDGSKKAISIKNNSETNKKLNEIFRSKKMKFTYELVPPPEKNETIKSWQTRAQYHGQVKICASLHEQSDVPTVEAIIVNLKREIAEEFHVKYESFKELTEEALRKVQQENEKTINRITEENDKIVKKLEQQNKNTNAKIVVHPLINFLSSFRLKIIAEYNKENSETIKSWMDLPNDFKKKREFLEPVVNKLGLEYEDWTTLSLLSGLINQFKHPQPFKFEEADEQIDGLIGTELEDYVVPFKNLIRLFRTKNWTD